MCVWGGGGGGGRAVVVPKETDNKQLCIEFMLKDSVECITSITSKLDILKDDQNNKSKEVFNCVGNVLNDFTNAYDSKCISPVPVSNRLLTGPGFEYDPQASIMVYNGAEDIDGQCKYEWSDNNLFTCETTYTQPIIRVYDNENLHCYTALVKHRGVQEVDQTIYTCRGSSSNLVVGETNCTMSITNFSDLCNGNWVPVLHLQSSEIGLSGFYLWDLNSGGGDTGLITCGHLPQGFLTTVDIIHLHMVPVGTKCFDLDLGSNTDPGLVYDNYLKDCRSIQYYGCEYEQYMINIIDSSIDGAGSSVNSLGQPAPGAGVDPVCNGETYEGKMSLDAPLTNFACTEYDIQLGQPKWGCVDEPSISDRDILRPTRDFNYSNKVTGYLAQEGTGFEFIGPDRQTVDITSIEQLIDIADIIRSTHIPNYKAARIPIKSDLNVEAWETYLQGYSDKRVLQYIKFGYPLSIENAEELCNKEITNHYSARQYPLEVQKYIDKEKSLGALLGPIPHIGHPHYHCSPLMTRPKDNGSRQVILDLSYPRGSSVNSHVVADRFDDSAFVLRFPQIDHIAEDIIHCTDDCVLFKVDVARAFRNLRVDPVDSLKFGIKWNGSYYANLAVAFGWTHGSAAYRFCPTQLLTL